MAIPFIAIDYIEAEEHYHSLTKESAIPSRLVLMMAPLPNTAKLVVHFLPMESSFGTLKSERVHQCTYRTRHEASPEVFCYIKGFYNRNRLHSSLDYLSPEAYEQLYHNQHERA